VPNCQFPFEQVKKDIRWKLVKSPKFVHQHDAKLFTQHSIELVIKIVNKKTQGFRCTKTFVSLKMTSQIINSIAVRRMNGEMN